MADIYAQWQTLFLSGTTTHDYQTWLVLEVERLQRIEARLKSEYRYNINSLNWNTRQKAEWAAAVLGTLPESEGERDAS